MVVLMVSQFTQIMQMLKLKQTNSMAKAYAKANAAKAHSQMLIL